MLLLLHKSSSLLIELLSLLDALEPLVAQKFGFRGGCRTATVFHGTLGNDTSGMNLNDWVRLLTLLFLKSR